MVWKAACVQKTVVLVEGMSDRSAVEALAVRMDRDLAAEGVSVIPMGGARSIRTFLDLYGPRGLDLRLSGLCDEREESDFRRGFERAGLGADLTTSDLEERGFFVCRADLEDEMIRALGTAAVERVIEREGELASLRIVQKQPAHRDRPPDQVLRRFFGTRSGRKIHYAAALVGALDLDRVPHPLVRLLAYV